MTEAKNKIKRTSRENESRANVARRKSWTPPTKLDAPPPPDGYEHRWIRTHIRGEDDKTNVYAKMREGWEPVRADEYEDAHTKYPVIDEGKDKGIIGRFIQSKRTRFERDDPSRERQKSGDMGMYDKKTIDFPEWTEKLGLKDIWSLETKAHGTGPQFKGEGGVGREKILEDQYKASYLRAVKKEIEKKRK